MDRSPAQYQSARDLPSAIEMAKQLRGLKSLTHLLRSQRAAVLELEAVLDCIVSVVDGFYELLGPRNWIFHESMSLDHIEDIIRNPPAEAEAALIAQYLDGETLSRYVRALDRFPQLRARAELIERATADYEHERFYSTAVVLIAVMDGFVNDVETQRRRGLHARDPEEMAAWDSVVGHHLGLANAHRTFTKTFARTSDEEVRELYRNGIVHGMLTNFDNAIVATKAWNRLFAVADWAKAREQQEREPEPEPCWRELFARVRANAEDQKALAEWRPRSLERGEPGFDADPLCVRVRTYLEAWRRENYGDMGRMLASLSREESEGKTAGSVRDDYSLVELRDFEITRLEFVAPAACEVDVLLSWEEETRAGRMRWIREDAAGDVALPNQAGEWRLVSWGPHAFIRSAA